MYSAIAYSSQLHTPSEQPAQYCGAQRLENDTLAALESLNRLLSFSSIQHEQHNVINFRAPVDSYETIEAIAIYLVSTIAGSIHIDLKIRSTLFGNRMIQRDLYRDVVAVVGESNDMPLNKKQTERDPWIWEGISHLFLHLSLYGHSTHPPDQILAKTLPKLNVKEHGLDIIALYGSNHLGITAAECKAYLQRPARAIIDASNRLQEIDDQSRDADIRIVIAQFTPVLSHEQKKLLIGTFWHEERSYFPMVCCDLKAVLNWEQKREVIDRLRPPANKKFLVPLSIENANLFFDHIADAMRKYIMKSKEDSDV